MPLLAAPNSGHNRGLRAVSRERIYATCTGARGPQVVGLIATASIRGTGIQDDTASSDAEFSDALERARNDITTAVTRTMPAGQCFEKGKTGNRGGRPQVRVNDRLLSEIARASTPRPRHTFSRPSCATRMCHRPPAAAQPRKG